MKNERFFGGDVQILHHCSANVVDCVGLELAHKDVVIDSVAYAATNDADGERQGCYGGYEILLKHSK